MASFPDIDDMSKIKDSLYNAGAIRLALQQYSKAVKIFSTYVKKFKDDDANPALYLQMAFAHEKMKKWKDARKIYKEYEKLYKKDRAKDMVQIHLLTAENYQKENSRKARKLASDELATAMYIYKKLSEKEQQDKKVKYAASRARFLEAEYVYQDFKDYVVIPFPQRKLVKTLQAKAELQQKAEKMYLEVLGLKSYQVSAGAFYRIADLYNTFAKSLTGLKPPPELEDNPELLDVYLMFIEEKVLPLEEKAGESARGALKLAHENRIYNEWSKRSAELLSKLSPESFPILNDEVVNSDWEVPATFSSTYIADPAGSPDMMLRQAEAAAEADDKSKDKADKSKDTGAKEGDAKEKAAQAAEAPKADKEESK
jgi:tetratricopeptide (TPR) repeat protein